MAIKEYNVDLDIKGRVLATTVPNSTGSIVTWNSSTNVFGTRTNTQIKSDIGANFTAGAGLTLSGTTFSLPVTISGSGDYVSDVTQTTNGITVTKATLPSAQTLSLGTLSGQIDISGGNSVRLNSLMNSFLSDVADIKQGLSPIRNLISDTFFPSQGAGIYNQRGASRSGYDFIIWKSIGSYSKLYYNRATNATNWAGWETFASEEWANSQGWLKSADLSGFIPYTGANQPINFNTQGLRIGGDFNKSFSTFERSHLAASETGLTHFTRLTDVASFTRGSNSTTQSDCIAITLPIRNTTRWVMEVDIIGVSPSSVFGSTPTKLLISAYHTSNLYVKVTAISGADNVKSVSFCRDANSNTVIIIRPQDGAPTTFNYGSVNISNFYHSAQYTADLAVKSNYKIEAVLESSLTGITTNGTINNAQFNRDGYYLDYNNFTNTPTIPTVNDGQLTLSTGTGLSGSATFTANQAGGSTFSVAVASTHKLPTITEWNALPTTNTITRLRGTATGTYTSGDLTLLAGAGIGVTQSGANITITNSSPNIIQTLSQTGQVVTLSNGGGSFTLPTPNAGTVTSVTMTTPTGLTVTGSPITSNGTLALGYASGYQGYTTAEADKLAGLSNYVLPTASATVLGGVKVGSGLSINASGVLSNSAPNVTQVLGLSGNTLSLSNGGGSVNLPTYTDTVTRLRGTTSGTFTSGDLTLLAGANTTITQSGTNITIASTNTNTTYTAGTGLSLTGTVFGQTITTSGTGSFVTGVTQTANGFQVNLGTPPNTTYTTDTLTILNTGTSTTGALQSSKNLNDWLNGKGFSTQTLTAGTNINIVGNVISAVNTNTTYSAGAGLTLSGTIFSLPITVSGSGNYVTNITQTTNGITVTKGTLPDLSGFVPYTGATANVNLGTRSITSTGGFIGNASTATTLATARTINGTSFNGSANIVTTNWGTARNITIGNTTKSVNGSANVTWSLSEIGVANQNLSLGSGAGQINISNGTGVSLYDLSRIELADFNNVSGIRTGSFTTFFNTTGSLGYPSAVGQGIMSLRGANTQGSFALWSSGGDSDSDVYLNVGRSTGWTGWKALATTDDLPTNYITTNTTQTGLTGNKTVDAIWTYAGARSYSLSLERTNGPNNSNIRYATTTSNVYAGIGDADYFAIGSSSDIRRSLSTTWMWVNSDGLTSRNGFSIQGRTNNDIVLAGGGHRPVSDFALAGSLGDYLPLSGGSMNNNVFINWLSDGRLTIAGVNRLVMNLTNTFLSATTGGTIYFRPNGHGSVLGQVTIDSSGQINTANHGNSSQWNHEVWGLGTEAVVNTGLFENINKTGFYAFSTSQHGFNYPRAMMMRRGSEKYGLIFQNSGNRVGFLTSDGSVYTAWHSGNLTFGSGLNYNASTGVLTTASQDSIFAYSPQGGLYTTDWSSTALGLHSVAIGYTSVVTASSSISIGKGVFTGGVMSQNIGFSSNVNKALSANVGSYNLNNAELGNTFGQGLINQGMGLTVIGKYNQIFSHQANMNLDERSAAIQFGVGKDELTRRNAITIYNDRRADYDINRDTTHWNNRTIPDIEYVQEMIDSGGGGGSGTGGAATYMHTDVSATHDFDVISANGLVSDIGLVGGPPLIDNMYSSVGVLVLDSYGSYVTPDFGNIYGQIGVTLRGGVIVNQGVIAVTGIRNLNIPNMGAATYLILIMDVKADVALSWLDADEIRAARTNPNNVSVVFIGQIYEYKGKPYFNVNPQIL